MRQSIVRHMPSTTNTTACFQLCTICVSSGEHYKPFDELYASERFAAKECEYLYRFLNYILTLEKYSVILYSYFLHFSHRVVILQPLFKRGTFIYAFFLTSFCNHFSSAQICRREKGGGGGGIIPGVVIV